MPADGGVSGVWDAGGGDNDGWSGGGGTHENTKTGRGGGGILRYIGMDIGAEADSYPRGKPTQLWVFKTNAAMKPLFISCVALAVAGCASQTGSSNGPAPAGEGAAFVQGTWRGHNAFYVARVDDAALRRPVVQRDWARAQAIAAGERTMAVRYEDPSAAIGGRPRGASAAIKVNVLAGVRYAPDGRDEGRTVALWVKRLDTGERVSDEVSARKDELLPLRPVEAPVRAESYPLMVPPPVAPSVRTFFGP